MQPTPVFGELSLVFFIQENVIGIPFRLKDYIELVDWTGRIIRDDKRGDIEKRQPKILERLSLDAENWKSLTTQFEEHFQSWVRTEHISRALRKTTQSMRKTLQHTQNE